MYRSLLTDFPDADAARIVRVLDAVLDSSLRAWSSGRSSMGDVRRTMSDAVALLVGPGSPSGGVP